MLDYTTSLNYMLTGYAIILVVLAAFITSLIVRWKRMKKTLEYLKEMDK